RGADRCQGGICRCGPDEPCGSGAPQCCNAADGGATCVDTERDPDFCGSCSASCDRDRVHVIRSCDAGACDYPCAPGWGRCPVGSRDPDCYTDLTGPENCGSCGRHCPAPDGGFARCTQGNCEQVCPGGQACSGTCYPLNDVNHCGNCATRCNPAVDGGAVCDG